MYRSLFKSFFCRRSEAKTPRWLDEQRVELLCISSYEEKLYRTMDSTVLYWRIHSLKVYFAAVLFWCFVPKDRITSCPLGQGSPPEREHRGRSVFRVFPLQSGLPVPATWGQTWGQAEKYQDKTPLQTPRAVILSFKTLCFIKISFSYHKTFSKVVTNLISWSQLSPYWTGDRANVQTGQNDTGESSSCLETNTHNWGRRK